jgi:glucose/arabinose dehydrogenase
MTSQPLRLHRRRSLVLTALAVGCLAAGLSGGAQSASQQEPAMSPSAKGMGQEEVPVMAQPPATRFFYPTGPDIFVPLPSEPQVYDTFLDKIRVSIVANGLSRPFSTAFLPDGRILVTERTGRLRVIKDGVLDPVAIAGTPDVAARPYQGLMDIALHPRFAENQWLYLCYTKPGLNRTSTIAVARGTLDGHALTDVRDVYVVDQWAPRSQSTFGSRIAFDREGLLYLTVASLTMEAQSPASARGKVLRLRDDGTPAPNNPFVGKAGYKPEIFTIGHRNALGLALHPETGEMYENENGPQGGDEINILKAGKNYGWPTVSQGRDYGGRYYPGHHEVLDMEPPFIYWNPAIAVSGMTFYTGDAFPRWKGNLFVGSLSYAHLERMTFNDKGEPTGGREHLLTELKQRIRDVRQGPDGNLYLLTDAAYGALLKVEPVD